jgi:deoxyribodipyrimidine photolyase-related protein
VTRRWLFADQLGPQFLDVPDQPVLLVESRAVFRRRRFHRAKAHLLLSALRHRALELGQQCTYLQVDTYDEALRQVDEPLSVVQPTSYAADRFVRERGFDVLPEGRGFATTREDFAQWVAGRKRLLMEDFYRWQRVRFDLLMDGDEPAGGRWNLDHDNRQPPPKREVLGLPEPWYPGEDDVDAQVREDLDRWERDGLATFVGEDRPRWAPATRWEALARLDHFVEHRLADFGPDRGRHARRRPVDGAQRPVAGDQPRPAAPARGVHAAEQAYRTGRRRSTASRATSGRSSAGASTSGRCTGTSRGLPRPQLPGCGATCRSGSARSTPTSRSRQLPVLGAARPARARLGAPHPALMVLGNYALQRGWDPKQVTAWFHEVFVDGYDWVMLPNVTGMSQHADGGWMTTKPYAAGGAYINRMSDYCGGCAYDPKVRVGPTACPYTAGYWAFLERNRERLQDNRRMRQPLRGLGRLTDLPELVEQERERGDSAP